MKKLTKTEKLWQKGEKIYDSFCGMFSGFAVATPRTSRLELFVLLKEKKMNELLLRALMEEFISNLDDMEVFAEKGKLYEKHTVRKPI